MTKLSDRSIIVVGCGPAGISAAIYAHRSGAKTTVIGKDGGALMKADAVENYYGFPEAVTGRELVERGISQAKRLGIEVIAEEVVGLGFEEKLLVKTAEMDYPADAIILATGASRQTPKIKGLADFEGKGVSYCASCDAFFYKGKDVAVLGCCDYALHEAMELLPVANSVTVITNGEKPIDHFPPEIKVITDKIAAFAGDGHIDAVHFENGDVLRVSGVFIAIGVAGSGDLAKKIGAETNKNRIVVDAQMITNVPGLFAAGDCTGGFLQIAKAVHEGAQAGVEAVKYVRSAQ
jgi:thioredoxin reductase (NADPH)